MQRIFARHGLSLDMADIMLDDLRRGIQALKDRPLSRSLRPDEGASLSHDATAATPDGPAAPPSDP